MGRGTSGPPPANTTGPIEQLWTPGQRTSNRLVFNVVIYVVGGIALLLALGYIALGTGLSSTSVAFVLALVPLTIVLLGVRWLDRWEPEQAARTQRCALVPGSAQGFQGTLAPQDHVTLGGSGVQVGGATCLAVLGEPIVDP